MLAKLVGTWREGGRCGAEEGDEGRQWEPLSVWTEQVNGSGLLPLSLSPSSPSLTSPLSFHFSLPVLRWGLTL